MKYFCKTHRQPFMFICVYCIQEERKASQQEPIVEELSPPARFRDIANGE
jgi:hypothetical protein